MNFKLLGLIAIICAPFMYINFLTSAQNVSTWKTGLFGLIYMAGWICSIIALSKMGAFGKTKWAKIAVIVQLSLLTLAQAWNVWIMFESRYDNLLFRILDSCWPLSNIWMLALGITALKAKQLQGWKRFVPLFVGLWFPLTVIPAVTMGYFELAGPYSAIAFGLLGFTVLTANKNEEANFTSIALSA